jgi:hypothetical protein
LSARERLLVALSICLGVTALSAASGPAERERSRPGERSAAWRNRYGPRSPELASRWLEVAQDEARRWAHLMPGSPAQALAAVQGLDWVNLGPAGARFQYNGGPYTQVDSGRTTGIAVHPTQPNIVYTSTAGGGIWKTFDFGSLNPRWVPVSEALPNLAIGALAMDPRLPDTLYAGLGDVFDVPGGQIVKTATGGAAWSAPVTLTGASNVRSLAVDPLNSNIVLAGTDVGLFRSTNGGQSFALVDLPNSGTAVSEAIWSIVPTGAVGGVSRWALSGVYAPGPGTQHPGPGAGDSTTPGDIWISTDAGATWSSRRAASRLPNVPAGRITLGAGTPSTGAVPQTVIYAQIASDLEYAGEGYWRSVDSGGTFVDITGTLGNTTLPAEPEQSDCLDVNVNGGQAWYNGAVAVDPANDAHVLVGGSSCGLRTLNGLSANPVWENVAHWLPISGAGDTAQGRLPYVHADWQKLTVVRLSSGYLALAGTGGGLFASYDVFNPSPVSGQTVSWSFPNRGIVSHQFHSVASGDPVTGDPYVTYGGSRDTGTRFRDTAPGAVATTFNQVVGGDGLAAVVSRTPSNTVYWSSSPYVPRFCDPDTTDCNRGESWFFDSPLLDGPTPCDDDFPPYYTSLAAIPTASGDPAVLHITDLGVYRLIGDPAQRRSEGKVWRLLGSTSATDGSGACTVDQLHRVVVASTNVDGLYGAGLSDGRFRVTTNCPLAADPTTCTWQLSSPLGVDLDASGSITPGEQVSFTSYLDFPPGPTGKPVGAVYVASSVAPVTEAGTPVPTALGHLFLTENAGAAWRSLKGNGTGLDLPNVPIHVVRYDPGDTTNATLYVGTDLGVYRTTDGGATWERFGRGMPMVKVTGLFISQTGAMMRAATFGRGLWEIYPSATAAKGVPGTGDWDRNQQIDFLDVLSTANRLGTTPATGSAPFYDWNQDLTGTVNAIDDGDLAQLLSRVGGRP